MTWAALALYLTLTGPADTTMTVVWHTDARAEGSVVWYAEEPDGGWKHSTGSHHPLPHSTRRVHVVTLSGLSPDTSYRFRIPHQASVERFRTLPRTATRPIRIACGGDTMHNKKLFAKTLEQVAKVDADLVAFGGDLAYGNGAPTAAPKWIDWCDAVTEQLVTESGRRIPVVCAIGNHEVKGGYAQRPDKAPFYHALFPSPGERGYDVLDLNEDTSLFLLNTGHTAPIGGAQTTWLDRELGARTDRPHLFAIYHVPGWPSHRVYSGPLSAGVRKHWSPLFEKHGLDVAFENHEHTYKRSPRIKAARVDPEGVVYLGDGAVGVNVRVVKSTVSSWWLEHAASVNHFILTTLEGKRRTHEGVDQTGKRFDRWTADAPPIGTEGLHILLQKETDAFFAKHTTPGLQIALVRDGAPVVVRGFGLAEAGQKRPLTATSVFQVASISKSLAAATALRLVEQKKLDLDKPVNQILSAEWKVRPAPGQSHDPEAVTLRRLLSHTAGLSVHGYPGLPPKVKLPTTRQSLDGVPSSNAAVRITQAPGDRWQYSGGGYTVVQLLIEQVTGKSFAEAAKELVLGPLLMTSSSYAPDKDVTKLCVIGHSKDGKPVPSYRFAAQAAASLHASAGDLALFLSALLEGPGGEPAGRGALTAATLDTMLSDQTPGKRDGYGLGFRIDAASEPGLEGLVFGHGGSNRGWKAVMLAHRQKRVAVVILANGDDAGGAINALANKLLLALVDR